MSRSASAGRLGPGESTNPSKDNAINSDNVSALLRITLQSVPN